MTEKETKAKQVSTEQPAAQKNETGNLIVFAIIAVFLIIWGFQHPAAALRVALVLVGFGGIVMVHELGHFIVAKLGKIKVEAFSIGMPPVLLGIRKLKKGWRVRVLPKMNQPETLQEGDHETEYQVGLIPIGGFVKMLGQSDTGAADADNDPRSYANRPVGVRIATVSAGVIFNAIGAIVIFIILFMNGINLPPAEVGNVVKNSPAWDAGIRAGDEIIEVNGDDFVDFTAVQLAPALSSPVKPVVFKVRHLDGTEETVEIIAERKSGDSTKLRYAGISQMQTLLIDTRNAKDPVYVKSLEKVGLRPGDEIIAVEDQSVSAYWEFEKALSETFQPNVTVRVSRHWPLDAAGQPTVETASLPVQISALVENYREEYDLAHFSGLVPRLIIEGVADPSKIDRAKNWIRTVVLRKEALPQLKDKLKAGDVLFQVADVKYPTYKQLRELTTAYEDKELMLTVLRNDEQGVAQPVEVTVTPKSNPGSGKRVMIGFAPGLDMNTAVVAQVLGASKMPSEKPGIPQGAVITAMAAQPVANYYDIAAVLQQHAGETIEVDYQLDGAAASVSLTVPEHEPVHAQASLGVVLPLSEYTRLFKASNPAEAVRMGFKKVWQFISQNYITLTRLIKNELPSSSLMGPVGIVSVSYQAAGYSLDRYLYFLGLISTALAVMNLLPLPVLDGGHIIFLLVEKITGKPINERVLAPIMYGGLALLLGLILWVTYNDVLRLLYS